MIVLSAEGRHRAGDPHVSRRQLLASLRLRDGRLLGRLSRSNVLKHLTQKESVVAPSTIRSALTDANTGKTSTIDSREPTPRAPQFVTTSVTSVLGGLGCPLTLGLAEILPAIGISREWIAGLLDRMREDVSPDLFVDELAFRVLTAAPPGTDDE